MPTQWLALQTVAHQTVQPVEALAHVRCTCCQINPCCQPQPKHRLHSIQHTQQTLQRRRIKPLENFHSLPSRKNNGQLPAQWPSCYFHRHQPPADLHSFTNVHFACSQPLAAQRAPLLSTSLPPDIQRSHCYSMLLAKFPSPQPAGLKCIQQLLCFSPAPAMLNFPMLLLFA